MQRRLIGIAALTLLSGCAIHPVPEDVTGVDSVDIVKQIRCEARDALTNIIKEKLADWALRGSSEAEALLRQYERQPEAISEFRPGLFPGPKYVQLRRLIKVFADTAIGYSFDLTMSETNDISADINLLKPLTTPKFTLGISTGASGKRSNQRIFTISDRFDYLLKDLNTRNAYRQSYCDGKIVRANYIYPIAGRIGVDKTIRTFVELTIFGSLGGKEGKGPPNLADKLIFTTALNLSANPKIEFTPVGNALQLSNAGLKGSIVRTDTHEVTVGLGIGPAGLDELAAFREFAFSSERGSSAALRRRPEISRAPRSGLYLGARITGGGTAAENMALEAIDLLKRRELQLIAPP